MPRRLNAVVWTPSCPFTVLSPTSTETPRLAPHLAAAKAAEDAFVLTTTVLGELYYGAHASQRIADNLAKLAAFTSQLTVYNFNAAAAAEFGKIKAE